MQVTVKSLLPARSLQRPPYGVPPDNPYIYIGTLICSFLQQPPLHNSNGHSNVLLLSKLDAYRTLLVSVSAYIHVVFVSLIYFDCVMLSENAKVSTCCTPEKKKKNRSHIRPIPAHNSHPSIMATFFCPQGDR